VLHFKDVTSVSELSKPETINAWYNNGNLNIKTEQGTTTVDIFNVQGQILRNYQLHGSGLQTLTVNLPAGVYFARLINDGKMQTVKIIVH